MEEEYAILVWYARIRAEFRILISKHRRFVNYTLIRADLVITHALEWPSLTVQWMDVRSTA